MELKLFTHRSVWWPTRSGWAVVLVTGCALIIILCFRWEPFLCLTQRVPAEILVVEGTLNREGVRAAGAEFLQGGYEKIVIVGGRLHEDLELLTGTNYAEFARHELLQSGVPEDRIIAAPPTDNGARRDLANAVRGTFEARGLHPHGANLFVFGIRGRLDYAIFTQALEPGIKVGVISWRPAVYDANRWWHSSERVRNVISETADFVYELFFARHAE